MVRLVLRRSEESAASPAEVAAAVASQRDDILDNSGRTMLVSVASSDAITALRNALPGWVISEQVQRIQVPDTRLKVGSRG